MARTITALFDNRADADAGRERLRAAGIDEGSIQVHDQTTHKISGTHSTHEDRGMWASIKNVFLPDTDRHAYEEGVRRGGVLLSADIDDDMAGTAVNALEDANSIDLDERSRQWETQGWTMPGSGAAGSSEALLYGERDSQDFGSRVRAYTPPRSVDEDGI